VAAGDSFTAAGFADQSHFARNFRKTFGALATCSLMTIRR
jgi:AraC-like DNA-binding protein